MKDSIMIKGDRNRWIDFVAQIKRERKEVWDVLSKFIDEYLKK